MRKESETYLDKQGKKYTFLEDIGEGAYGEVMKVKDEEGQVFAIKKLKLKDFRKQEQIFYEKVKNQKGLLKINDYIIQDKQVLIFQEYCDGGNLESQLQSKLKKGKKYSLKEALEIILDLCKQLQIIHSMNYIFQDLKPANVVLKKSQNSEKIQYKLCDFGSVTTVNSDSNESILTQSRLGTAYYIAPECIELSNIIDQKVDIWALGVIYFELVTGRKLFDGSGQSVILDKIKKFQNNQEEALNQIKKYLIFNEKNYKFLLSMFEPTPENRPNIQATKIYFEKMLKRTLQQQINDLQNQVEDYKIEIDDYWKKECLKLQSSLNELKFQNNKGLLDKYNQFKDSIEYANEFENNNWTCSLQEPLLKYDIDQEKYEKLLKYTKSAENENKILLQKLSEQSEKIQYYEEQLHLVEDKNEKLHQLLNNSEYQNQNLQILVEKYCKTIQIQNENIRNLKQESQDKEYLINQVQDEYKKFNKFAMKYLTICNQIDNTDKQEIWKNTIPQGVQKYKQQSSHIKNFFQICQTCKDLSDDMILKQKPVTLVLSQSTQGIQLIMKILFPELNNQIFQMQYQKDIDYFFISRQFFEFKKVDENERQLQQYKKIFEDNPHKFNLLWIVVKFERIDLMKKSLMSVYKYVHKLKISFSIIIYDFHLSENQEKDKQEVRTKLELFKLNSIVFIGQFTTYEELIKKLKQALPEQNPNQIYRMQLEGTFFKDQEEQQSLC